MNNRLNWQQFKVLFFVQSLFALFLDATDRASASEILIKDTNYPIPNDAYFVSPDGRDTNSGRNPASPWSVAKAFERAPDGGTIVFRGGTYRNIDSDSDVGHIRKRLTLQPYPHEQAWIKGSVVVTGWDSDGNTWRKDRWNYSFPSNLESRYIQPEFGMAGYRDMVYVNGVSLKQVRSKAEVGPGKFYVDSARDKLYIGDNPTRKTVEATARERALKITKGGRADGSRTLIRGLGFAHFADESIAVGAPQVTLENNTIVWNGIDGVHFWGDINGRRGISADAIVRGNTFSYNGMSGVSGDRVHRMVFEDNTLSYNNFERFFSGWSAGGIKVLRTNGLVWRNNLVERNFAHGMWIDESSTNATIVNNVVRHNNEKIGILMEISHNAIIASNLVYKNAIGIKVYNASSARLYNNTLSQNERNLVVQESPRNNTDANQIAAGITWITRNTVVKNNILSNATGSQLFDAWNCINNRERSSLMIRAADYNAYYRTSLRSPQDVIRWSLGRGRCTIGYSSISAFNSVTGYEQNALEVRNVSTNPFFVSEAREDYRLKSNSPAIGRGEAVPEDIARATGLPSGRRVDLGALQSRVDLVY